VRRIAVAVLALVSLFCASAVAAEAGTTKSVSYTLTGSSEWNAVLFPSSFAISGQLSDGAARAGTYTGTLLALSYADDCSAGPWGPNCGPATGSITFALRGGSITASVEPGGLVTQRFTGPSLDSYVFELTLDVTGGTRAYADAQGTLSMFLDTTRDNLATDPVTLAPCGFVDITKCPISDSGTLTGTITR
jgi:hypothetical protein